MTVCSAAAEGKVAPAVDEQISRLRNPRCILLYALAPEYMSAAQANLAFNQFVADRRLPLVLWHGHFIGVPGGVAIVYTETPAEREALLKHDHLADWQVELCPLIFSHNPGAFDEQITFTLRAYRALDRQGLRRERRPSYGDPQREAETAQENLE